MQHALRSVIVAAAMAGCLCMVGCPAPMLHVGYDPGSRGNLPAAQPEWIVAGATSREEVLLRLGTPDEQARDSRWLGYLSSRHESGVLFVVPPAVLVAETYTARRLVVWVDERGIVTRTDFVQKECQRSTLDAGGDVVRSEPCLGFAGLEGFAGIRTGTAGPEIGAPVGSFHDIVWCTPFFDVEKESAPQNFVAYRGPVVVTGTALVVSGTKLGGNTTGHVRLEFREMKDIARYSGGLARNPSLVVRMADDVEYQLFAVQPGLFGLNDREGTERLIGLVENAVQRPARAR